MKLQLWTTVNGQADELLGEIDIDDQNGTTRKTSGGDALELMQQP